MSKSTMNTHRRPMRAVTPVGRLGRNAAGAAIAAGIIVGGAGAANAGGEAQAEGPSAAHEAPATVAPRSEGALTITIPTTGTPAGSGMLAAASAAPSVSIQAPEPVAAPAPAEDSATEDSATEDSAATTPADSGSTRSSRAQRGAADRSSTSRDSSEDSAQDSESSSSTRRSSSSDEDQQGSAEESGTQRSGKKSSEKASSASSSDDSEAPAPAAGGSIVSTARSGIGVPYVYGGSSRGGWDCSGFTAWVYAQHGISLPHSASAQRSMGTTISASEARPGDLVYTPGHVGIYAGNGRIIDAGTSAGTTSERAMWSASWTYVRIG